MNPFTRTILAVTLFIGFLGLAVFGMLGTTQEGETFAACMARSAGIVSCLSVDHAGASFGHDSMSFLGLMAAALSMFALVLAAFGALPLSFDLPRAYIPARAQLPSYAAAPSVLRLRSWLSLFESSPGR